MRSSGAWIIPQRWSHLEAQGLLVPRVSQAPAVAGWLQHDVPGQWLSRSLLETEVAVSA